MSILRVLFVVFCFVSSAAHAKEILTMDIAGISIGMEAEEAIKILKDSGFVRGKDKALIPAIQPGHSFQQQVLMRQKKLPRNTEPDTFSAVTLQKGYEEIHVKFLAMPQGTLVSYVAYKTADPAMDSATFKKRVYKKYGKPNGKSPDTWTSRAFIKDELSNQMVEDPKAVSLDFSQNEDGDLIGIRLEGGEYSYRDAYDALQEALKPAIQPKPADSSF